MFFMNIFIAILRKITEYKNNTGLQRENFIDDFTLKKMGKRKF